MNLNQDLSYLKYKQFTYFNIIIRYQRPACLLIQIFVGLSSKLPVTCQGDFEMESEYGCVHESFLYQ